MRPLTQSLQKRVASSEFTAKLYQATAGAAASPVVRRRIRGKTSVAKLGLAFATEAKPASARGRRKCGVEWCDNRAQVRLGGAAADAYCKQHVRWFGRQAAASGAGYRVGYFAARARLEDFASSRVWVPVYGKKGVMDQRCPHCGALFFKGEWGTQSFGLCCRSGKLKHLPKLPKAPAPLSDLYAGLGDAAEHFKQNVRRYNAALAFASFNDSRGAGTERPAAEGRSFNSRGPPVYIMHGQAYHAISTLYPSVGQEPRFGQLYI